MSEILIRRERKIENALNSFTVVHQIKNDPH